LLTPAALRDYTLKDLAQMAKKRGVSGWHSMRKDQLVQVLARLEKPKMNHSLGTAGGGTRSGRVAKGGGTSNVARRNPPPKSKSSATDNGKDANATAGLKGAPTAPKDSAANAGRVAKKVKDRDPRMLRRIQEVHAQRERLKDLSERRGSRDRIVLMVRDPYWLHAFWELTSRSVERAQVALAQHWHTAMPTLRLLKLAGSSSEDSAETVARDIQIHGAVRNWYIDVQDPPSSFRAEVGYLTSEGRFHALARSNTVITPPPGSTEMLDGNWADVADNCDKIYAMSGGYDNTARNGELQELFEERLRRPMGSPMITRFGTGAAGVLEKNRRFCFDVDTELIIYGITKPDAFVTMAGEPVKLRPDGTFTARVGLPERRQVIPVVASSSDGVEQQTIVLAVERNTKVMEPIVRDGSHDRD
jgi:hypothetical protein